MPVQALLFSMLLPVASAAAIAAPLPQGIEVAHTPPTIESGFWIPGPVELDQPAAVAGARVALEGWAQEYGDTMLQEEVERSRPVWVPGFLLASLARSRMEPWTARDLAVVVDQEMATRQHEFGLSYRASLQVEEHRTGTQRFQRGVQSAVRAAEWMLLLLAGGTVVYWGGLILLVGWFDRLTRGYMTRRLALLGVLAGVGIPPLPFLF